MVNELRTLMQEAVATAAGHDAELDAILRGGRQRVRRRRARLAAGTGALVATTVALGVVAVGGDDPDGDRVAQQLVPRPEGPVTRLTDAVPGAAGTDYEVLAKHTNKDLNQGNGQYFEGLTEDGLILYKDGPHGVRNTVRYGLREPATGTTDWLPSLGRAESNAVPVSLDSDRLVLADMDYSDMDFRDGDTLGGPLVVHVFDRPSRTWGTLQWGSLPRLDGIHGAKLGPNGRLYVPVRATQGSPPPGGWPVGPDGEADDAGAEGETYDLWSVSLTDTTDVRDEKLRVGNFAFTADSLVWSATTNGINDRIHVRDLDTGEEHAFDPESGERCNLLGFGASGDRIMLSQYCGTYDDGRDDRIQVLTTSGETVTTIQGNGMDGWIGDGAAGDGRLVGVRVSDPAAGGYYVYELERGRLVRVTDDTSSWGVGGPTPAGHLFWDTPYGAGAGPDGMDSGATQWLVRWRN